MNCTSCGQENPAANRFCGGCGAALARACPSCGHVNPADHRFCGACGATLAALPNERAEARKVVTIVFADLIGSTSLHERLDPESVNRVMDRYYRAVRVPVEAHGGTVVQLLGDGVMCAFGVPHVAEDDAIRAVRAAVGVQQAFREFARAERDLVGDVGLRVAVNTGEVVVSDDYAAGIGDPLNVAARLQQEARDGDVLIGESTERLVRDRVTLEPLGRFSLKGRAESVAAYRVVSLERPAGAAATPFVGRDGELRRLVGVYDSAVATPAARLAVILGSPGLGKSRLLDELARRLTGATVLTAACEATGGATFAPIARALRAHLRIGDGIAGTELRAEILATIPGADLEDARVIDGAAALLAATPASPEETFFVIRRVLARLADSQPVVLAIDDLQWAEPLLLDLIEHLVQWSPDVPLLLLAAARPELRETRSSLATPGGLVAEVVTLAGLDAGAATRLAANVIGTNELPAVVAGRVLATSEGNPLFVGELVRMLVHDGALRREGDRWVAGVELAGLEMPPTIQALLAARIERLRPEERSVLERAAVVGRQFSRAAVTHLLPREITDLDTRLEALKRSELIEPDSGWFLGEPALRFHHVLIRDAAYRRLLKNTRAELHARFAEWLEARAGGSVEHDETLGWHLEQAYQHLRELGPPDAHGRVLGERAARYLAAAGRRALARDDLPVAANLLGRALALLDSADPARADLALDWCEALLAAGDVAAAAKAIAELGRLIGDSRSLSTPASSQRLRAWHTCFAGELAALTDPKALRATADAVAAAAEELAAAGDDAGEAKAHSVHALALSRLGQVGASEAALDRALAAARRAHDRRRANAVLAGAPLAALWGPGPVTRASGRCLDVVRVLRITQGAPAVEAVALRCQGVLEALRGRTEAARRMIASSRRMVEELGLTQGLLETELSAGLVELIEGDDAAAEKCLRAAYDGFRDHALAIDAARAAGLLGRTLLPQGRAAEAEALSHESEALAGDDLQAAITWRRVRAEALALRGEHTSAIEFASEAVEIAAATDALLHHADARLALATALRAAGRSAEADAEERRAIELWEAKGATLPAERARRGAGRIEPVALAPVESTKAAYVASRRVRANAATACMARTDAAFAARDADAIPTLLDEYEVVDHTTGVSYGRQGEISSYRALARAQDPKCRHEPLATLGDSLALSRVSMSASSFAGGTFDVGAYDREQVGLVEVDAQGRGRRAELFARDRLGDAITRLYARYAELLPEGPERSRAAATARSVATMLGPKNSRDERLRELGRSLLAPDVKARDHRTVGFGSLRGPHAVLQAIGTLRQLSDDFDDRIDEVIDLRCDALLLRWTSSGTVRASGGAFTQDLCMLFTFGADGLVTRWEQFDAGQDADALARFDALTTEPAAPRPVRRRVRANAATANAARLDELIAARDAEGLPMLFAEDHEVIDHTRGVSYGRSGTLDHYRRLFRSQDVTYRHEPLATLGDSLVLGRLTVSGSGAAGRTWDVGAFDYDNVELLEVDAEGRRHRHEVFATDHLGDAVVRLYERYAELLPEGLEHTRATATARALPMLMMAATWDSDRHGAVFAPEFEFDDRRTVGVGTLRGVKAFLRAVVALVELSEGFVMRIEDVLALRSDVLLARVRTSGTDRASGGAFERPYLWLTVFGSDGLAVRIEQFDLGYEDDALARVDALTAAPRGPRAVRRRLRPNLATAHTARFDVAIAAQDADAVPALFTVEMGAVDHLTHTRWDRENVVSSWRSLARAEQPTCRHEPLATLGDSLALCRMSLSARRLARGSFDVGGYEKTEIHLIEVDGQERRRWTEVFAVEKLAEGIVRIYERYAELLPEGPERARAAATARSVATLLGPIDHDFWATAFAPGIDVVDHRILGTFSGSGAEALLQNLHAWLELGADLALSVEDVLALEAGALLQRVTFSGTDRASGGAFERPLMQLLLFGRDGLVTRLEQFDIGCEVEALARFDELLQNGAAFHAQSMTGFAAPPPPRAAEKLQRRVRPNAATTNAARFDTVIASRDAEGLRDLFAEDCEVVEHPTGAVYDREGVLTGMRALLRAREPAYRHEPLATLGDALALCRVSWSASGFAGGTLDVGPYEDAGCLVIEVDAQGRRRRDERFDVERLGDAVVRLYERYAELLSDGSNRERAAATARSVGAMLGPVGDELWAPALESDVEMVDHRILGTASGQGKEVLLQHLRGWLEVGSGLTQTVDEVLGLASDAVLTRRRFVGTDRVGGGAFERLLVQLLLFGADGLVARVELFDADRAVEALARFDELTAEKPGHRVRPNAATANAARTDAAITACDADAIACLVAEGVEVIDHTTGVTYDRQGWLATVHAFLRAQNPSFVSEPLATLGEALALVRVTTSASGFVGSTFDVGAYVREEILLGEVDAQGKRRRVEVFAVDRLDDAIVRLYERYADHLADGPTRARAVATARVVATKMTRGAFDLDRYAATFAPGIESVDHRILGTWTASGAEALRQHTRALVEVAGAVTRHIHMILGLRPDALLVYQTNVGTARSGGGLWERSFLWLIVFGPDGRVTRHEFFDVGQETAALARFDELAGVSRVARFENSAMRWSDRFKEAWEARDWDRVAAAFSPAFQIVDRRKLMRLELERGSHFDSLRLLLKMHSSRFTEQMLATRGDRLALQRWRFEGSGRSVGPMEVEYFQVCELDEGGHSVAMVMFDPDDLDAAYAELDARYVAGEAAPFGVVTAGARAFAAGVAVRDWDAVTATLAPDLLVCDHRPLGWETLHGPAMLVDTWRSLVELAPDVRLRIDHCTASATGSLAVLTLLGTHEGGDFEDVRVVVHQYDANGKIRQHDIYNLDQIVEARACFAELRG